MTRRNYLNISSIFSLSLFFLAFNAFFFPLFFRLEHQRGGQKMLNEKGAGGNKRIAMMAASLLFCVLLLCDLARFWPFLSALSSYVFLSLLFLIWPFCPPWPVLKHFTWDADGMGNMKRPKWYWSCMKTGDTLGRHILQKSRRRSNMWHVTHAHSHAETLKHAHQHNAFEPPAK